MSVPLRYNAEMNYVRFSLGFFSRGDFAKLIFALAMRAQALNGDLRRFFRPARALRCRSHGQRQAERAGTFHGVGVGANQLAHDRDSLATLNDNRFRESRHFVVFQFNKKAGHDKGFSRVSAFGQRLLLYARICAYMLGGEMS